MEKQRQKRLGTEGINEKKAKAFVEVYERSSKLPKPNKVVRRSQIKIIKKYTMLN
jgi:hypothetical protein